jgi:hypothetical protein
VGTFCPGKYVAGSYALDNYADCSFVSYPRSAEGLLRVIHNPVENPKNCVVMVTVRLSFSVSGRHRNSKIL